jgi:hypothetical protein
MEYFMVPGARIELAQLQEPRDFKSLASTSSAIRANKYGLFYTFVNELSINVVINSD